VQHIDKVGKPLPGFVLLLFRIVSVEELCGSTLPSSDANKDDSDGDGDDAEAVGGTGMSKR
jgi:hypothetical protein